MTPFEYDVAFSFLDADLGLVRDVEDRLEGRFKTFIYADQQDKLAGTDGQESFRRVFEHDARTVVVLFREGWGKGGMTGVEMLAMKDRGHRELFDWLLVVVLGEARPDPRFVPKTQIYLDYPRYGMDRLVGAIVNHVTRNAGEASEATVEGAMAAAMRARELEAAREEYRNAKVFSEPGWYMVPKWTGEVKRFHELLVEKARSTKVVQLTCGGEPGNRVSITGPGAFVTTCVRHDSEGAFMWCGFHTHRGESDLVEEWECYPDLDSDHQPAWRLNDRRLRSEHLAEQVLRRLAVHMKPP